MKDGRTHLAHKAEHAVDLETGAVVAVTVQDADEGDTTTSRETLIEAAEQIEAVRPDGHGLKEVVGDKGYHSNQSLVDLEAVGVRSYISEPGRGRRNWKKKPEAQAAVYRNRRRIRGRRGLRLLRLRGERLERPFAHLYDTGGMRRVYLRGHTNIRKRLLIHGRLKSRPAHATTDRRGHAARTAGAAHRRRGCSYRSSAGSGTWWPVIVGQDGRFHRSRFVSGRHPRSSTAAGKKWLSPRAAGVQRLDRMFAAGIGLLLFSYRTSRLDHIRRGNATRRDAVKRVLKASVLGSGSSRGAAAHGPTAGTTWLKGPQPPQEWGAIEAPLRAVIDRATRDLRWSNPPPWTPT